MFQVAWLNARPYCWVASTDGGETWHKLVADDPDDSSAALDEAQTRFGSATSVWYLLDDALTKIRKAE